MFEFANWNIEFRFYVLFILPGLFDEIFTSTSYFSAFYEILTECCHFVRNDGQVHYSGFRDG